MNEDVIRDVLDRVKSQALSIDEACKMLTDKGYQELDYAKIDTDRVKRRGFPEVVFCEGKTTEEIKTIMLNLARDNSNILASRATEEQYQSLKAVLPEARYNKRGRVIVLEREKIKKVGSILIVSAGTSDLYVVEEARETASIMGNNVEVLCDVGVAGIHRLLNNVDYLKRARVLIVVAGMEGALASVVAGLVDKPVIAVPTSVGYGANLKGLAPLLTMINSCVAGIGVVNIDNGFGAAYLASLINKIGE
jgi:pyridinium-3,5-biscarboxylic acid mononucleotide synthase